MVNGEKVAYFRKIPFDISFDILLSLLSSLIEIYYVFSRAVCLSVAIHPTHYVDTGTTSALLATCSQIKT